MLYFYPYYSKPSRECIRAGLMEYNDSNSNVVLIGGLSTAGNKASFPTFIAINPFIVFDGIETDMSSYLSIGLLAPLMLTPIAYSTAELALRKSPYR